MSKPPKVEKMDDFCLDTPDVDDVAKVDDYAQQVRDVIMSVRMGVLVNGSLASELMILHRMINNSTEIAAKFALYAHPRLLGKDSECKFNNIHKCLLFTVLKLIIIFQWYKNDKGNQPALDSQIAQTRAISCSGLHNFEVAGSERNGYYLKLKKNMGLRN
jgi:hypothetical protein